MKQLLVVLFLFAGMISMKAQGTVKLGHINSQELVAIIPATKQKQADFESFAKKMNQSLEALQVEFNVKYKAYQDSAQVLSGAELQSREMELKGLQDRIQAFQMKAQEDLQKKRKELFGPVMESAQKAIEEVAKENGFTYVFDLSTGPIIYKAENSIDLLPLVKKKLGVQ